MVTMATRPRSSTCPIVAVAILWAFPSLIQAAAEVKDVDAAAVHTSQEVLAQQRFSCGGKTPGYYADVHSGCQRYHMCDSGGRLYSYSCPNQTLFQQRVMICDHWFMVDCSLSANYFSSNLNIGVKGRPFISGEEEPSRRRPAGTTPPYPLLRSTPFTPGEPIRRQQVYKPGVKNNVEKTFKIPVTKNENKVVTKYDNANSFSPPSEIPLVRTLPKEYANNPFFRGLTARPTEAPNIITTEKGHAEVLTSPRGKVHSNVFGKNSDSNNIYFTSTTTTLETTTAAADQKYNAFSTPIQELRQPLPNNRESSSPVFTAESPLNSEKSFVTPRGRFDLYQEEFQNAYPSEEEFIETPPSTDDHRSLVDDEEISSNTVELRIPDTRHMFYIADTPTREAEMLNSNNETVLTIALPSSSGSHNHGPMKFKGSRNPKGRREDCPQCHPAFLLPGRCQPCVLIRR